VHDITVKTNCFNHRVVTMVAGKLRGGGCERFTLVLETTCTRQIERKQAQIIFTITLQILTAKQTSARETYATIKDMSISITTLQSCIL